MSSDRTRSASRPSVTAWLSRSLGGWLGKGAKISDRARRAAGDSPPVAPTKAETMRLPRFSSLPLERIFLPRTGPECAAAVEEILAAGVAGFDTEAKPTFRVGEKSGGPHVIQFALADRAFLFQLHRRECLQAAAELIASERVLKVGFGLKNDHGQIRGRLGVTLRPVVDLDHVFRRRGYRSQMGVRAAMGAVLQRNFPKSKTTTKSNWAAKQLTPRQILYAANDAYAALKIMEALNLSPDEMAEPERAADKAKTRKPKRKRKRAGAGRRRPGSRKKL